MSGKEMRIKLEEAGFLPCDGATMNRSDYLDLYAAIQDIETSEPLLPDRRGLVAHTKKMK